MLDFLYKIIAVVVCIPMTVRQALFENSLTVLSRFRHRSVWFGPKSYADKLSRFEGRSFIWDGAALQNVRFGKYSYCAHRTRINYAEIGRYVSIGSDSLIGLGVHPSGFVSTFPGFYSKNKHAINYFVDDSMSENVKTYIGNDVWIGAGVIIPGGVTIGDGAIIAAGSVVTKDVPPYSIMGGVPAKLIRSRFSQDVIDKLLKIGRASCRERV
jgi:acetyltransferase-like isoleucine patch superfamily enzyme